MEQAGETDIEAAGGNVAIAGGGLGADHAGAEPAFVIEGAGGLDHAVDDHIEATAHGGGLDAFGSSWRRAMRERCWKAPKR